MNYRRIAVALGVLAVTVFSVARAQAPKQIKIGMVASGQYALVADGKNGFKVVQLFSSEATPDFYGFSPKPVPKLIALAPVKPPTTYPLPPWRKLTPEERRKRPYIPKESPLPGGVTPAEQISAPAMTAVPAFQVHESPLRVEQQPIIKTQLEAYAASKTFGVAKTEDLKTDIATLLASKSGLRDAIILREIFGPPRGLQALEIGT